MFANCTHVIGSLLKAWKVTVVWMSATMPFRLTPFQEGTHHKLLAQKNHLISASKVANWITVDILKYSNKGLIIFGKKSVATSLR